MRVRTAAAVPAAIVTLLLVAGSALGDAPTSAAAAADPLARVQVTQDADGAATLRFTPPLAVRTTTTRVLERGTGPKPGRAQRVSYDFTLVDARDGRVLQTTAGRWPTSTVRASSRNDPIARTASSSRAGSTTIVAIAPLEGVAKRLGPLGAEPDDTLLALVQVRTLHPVLARATGTAVPPAAGLPVVTLDEKQRPLLGPSSDPPPGDRVAQPLVLGTGSAVTAGAGVELHYTGFRWTNGQIVETTWLRGAPVDVTLGSSQALPAFDALVGLPVGSRVLIVVPPGQGYGPDGDARLGIAPTETLVYVVDILDAY